MSIVPRVSTLLMKYIFHLTISTQTLIDSQKNMGEKQKKTFHVLRVVISETVDEGRPTT
jgi:hypothetical protein